MPNFKLLTLIAACGALIFVTSCAPRQDHRARTDYQHQEQTTRTYGK